MQHRRGYVSVAVAVLVACGVAPVVAPQTGKPTMVASAAAAALPAFSSSTRPIDPTLAQRMRFSWRPGCPVPLTDLRYLRMTFYGFDGIAHTGEMVVHRAHAKNITSAFRRAYVSRFPIRRMRLVDYYRGSDEASMAANNTSAFNCRRTTRGTAWSQHSYGRAVDINPIQNPYVSRGHVEPAAGASYVKRWPLRKGMLTWTVRDAFADVGWHWGGSWLSLKDYMHFSANNR
jgi:poly-gamma-glutamate synthesis protein (capsule biosynthesis protein)